MSNDDTVDQSPAAEDGPEDILVATIEIYDSADGENVNVIGKLADPTCLDRSPTPGLILASFLASHMELVSEMAKGWSNQISRQAAEEVVKRAAEEIDARVEPETADRPCPTHESAQETRQ